MRPYWTSFLLCRDLPLLRKGKVLMMQILMSLHAPTSWVDWVYDLKRAQNMQKR